MLPFPFLNSMGLPSSKLGFVAKPEMPPHLNVLFRARPPLEYLKPIERPKYRKLEGILETDSNYLSLFENGPPPERVREETPKERKEREWREKMTEHVKKVREELKTWDPKANPDATLDPYKTLFVCKLNKETTEKHLKRVFEEYGPVRRVVIVRDKLDGKSRHYAFIEYENVKDFKEAYKNADGKKINGRKVYVDYERGRTVAGWRPRRLGGGKGITRRSKEADAKVKEIWREIEEEENLLKQDDEEIRVAKSEPKSLSEPQREDEKTEESKEKKSDRHHKKDVSRDRYRSRSRDKEYKRADGRKKEREAEEKDHHKKKDSKSHKEKRHRSKERDGGYGKSRRHHSKDRYEEDHGRKHDGARKNGIKRSESRESGEIVSRK